MKKSIYVFNNIHDYERVNCLYLNDNEVNEYLTELSTEGSYLFNKYTTKYKYKLIVDESLQGKTIQQLITEQLKSM